MATELSDLSPDEQGTVAQRLRKKYPPDKYPDMYDSKGQAKGFVKMAGDVSIELQKQKAKRKSLADRVSDMEKGGSVRGGHGGMGD